MRVIGLTGGIATGKSSVAAYLARRGAVIIDADLLSREAVTPGSNGLKRIVELFGSEVLQQDGTLDRKRLGALVFADCGRRKQLEQILHPEIRRLASERIAAAAAEGAEAVFYMAPLLIEAGADACVDEIWVVTVDPEIQLKRLMARDGLGRDAAERIVATQMPLAEKARYGRVIIDNSSNLDELYRRLADIWKHELEDGK